MNYNSNATFDDESCEYDSIPPSSVVLYPIEYVNGSFIINWSINSDEDFNSYSFYFFYQ